jgi:hypothetical protein
MISDSEFPDLSNLRVDSGVEMPPASESPVAAPNSFTDEDIPQWQLQYDNPEVFGRDDLPQHYRLQIRNYTYGVAGEPVLHLVIDGDRLLNAFDDGLLAAIARKAGAVSPSGQILDEGELQAIREELPHDPAYNAILKASRDSFARLFPNLLIKLYDLTAFVVLLDRLQTLGKSFEEYDAKFSKKELKESLALHVKALDDEVQRMLGVHGGGRPPKQNAANLSKSVRAAARKALTKHPKSELKLSAVAATMGKTEAALSKQLDRAGVSWREIKKEVKSRHTYSNKVKI